MRPVWFAWGLTCLSACTCDQPAQAPDAGAPVDAGTDAGPGGSCIPGLQHILISPDHGTAALQLGQSSTVSFSAAGVGADGSSRDITRRVAWVVSRGDGENPGPIDPDGTYHPARDLSGVVSVQASDGCVVGQTTLSLTLEVTIVEDGSIPPLFAGPAVQTPNPHLPSFLYPSDQTRVPRNLWDLLIQWNRAGNTSFRLSFNGPFSHVTVYTLGSNGPCAVRSALGCWETNAATWEYIARQNAGYPVLMRVEGHTAGDPNVYVGPDITFVVSKADWPGEVLYWSTTQAGLVRSSWAGRLPWAAPPRVLPGGARVQCVGCHTMSASGRLVAAGVVTTGSQGVSLIDASQLALSVSAPFSSVERQFSALSPDDTRLVTGVGLFLHAFDADGGADVGQLPIDRGGQPNWSPNGKVLAYVDQAGEAPRFASVMALDYLGGDRWAPVGRLLAPAADGGSNLYPAFSPDGQVVAFAAGRGGHDDLETLLEVVGLDGGPPVELFNANRIVNNQVTDGAHENSLPTWAPTRDYAWIAFSSQRPYGGFIPDGGATDHIWVAAIDLAKLGTGSDPSYPAVYYPFQAFGENNHRAYWTNAVIPPPPLDAGFGDPGLGGGSDAGATDSGVASDAGACLPQGAACNQINPPPCCSGGLCDLGSGGGFVCR